MAWREQQKRKQVNSQFCLIFLIIWVISIIKYKCGVSFALVKEYLTHLHIYLICFVLNQFTNSKAVTDVKIDLNVSDIVSFCCVKILLRRFHSLFQCTFVVIPINQTFINWSDQCPMTMKPVGPMKVWSANLAKSWNTKDRPPQWCRQRRCLRSPKATVRCGARGRIRSPSRWRSIELRAENGKVPNFSSRRDVAEGR